MSEQLPHDEDLRALYRKLPPEEPRAEIDEAILAAARAQIHQKHRARFLRRLGWTVPLAAAASIAVTITLLRIAPEQTPYPNARLDEGVLAKAPQARAGATAPDRSALSPPAETVPEVDAAVEQKLKNLGYIDDSDVEAKNIAPDTKRDESQKPPQAAAAPAPSPSAKSSDAGGGWEPMGAGRSLETVDSAVARARQERESVEARMRAEVAAEVKRKTEAARPAQPAAPPPAVQPQADTAVAAKAGTPSPAANVAPDVSPRRKAEPPPAPPSASGRTAADAAALPRQTRELSMQHGEAPSAELRDKDPTEEPMAELQDSSKDAPSVADAARPGGAAGAAGEEGRNMQEAASSAAGAVAAVPASWPFRLEAGLDANESCRRVAAALKTSCRFSKDTATVALRTPKPIDAGEFAGSRCSRLRLVLKNGKLWKLSLLLEGYETEQVLIAPPER